MNIDFSIAVLSHNNEYICLVLNSSLEQMEDCDEMIVVDDHSETSYFKNLEEFTLDKNIRLIKANKIGNRSHNMNIGAKYAKRDVLLFVDGDMVLIDHALLTLRYSRIFSRRPFGA